MPSNSVFACLQNITLQYLAKFRLEKAKAAAKLIVMTQCFSMLLQKKTHLP